MIFSATEATLDDLMRIALETILSDGGTNVATRGTSKELLGVTLELTQPRARLSRTETRGKVFSCLGELCWYLSGSDALAPIAYYVKRYEEEASGDRVLGGYGPRLCGGSENGQIQKIIKMLRRKPSSRQAVIQLFDRQDLQIEGTSVPCTCTLQFLVRDDKLNLITHMRSNDAYLGLPHDLFCFTMIQEIVAVALGYELGTYVHMVGSLHLYDGSVAAARQFLNEGWQSTTSPMPAMPNGDPWDDVGRLLSAEEKLRTNQAASALGLPAGYWGDLIRLLGAFRARKNQDTEAASAIIREMSSRTFDPYF